MLSSRESILSLATGIPYQHFNFLHRWTGLIIFIQSFFHTLAWTLIEGRLYKPQPTTWNEFISEQYIIFGIVAMLFITFLTLFSTKTFIHWTGYEFFRKSHYIVAMLYFGACWAHWAQLACWMIASIGIMFIDRGIRLLRTGLIHSGYKDGKKGLGFRSARSTIQIFSDGEAEVVRLDFDYDIQPWAIGQHFYLCFPELSVWQAHPMTPSSVPVSQSGPQHHTYIIRALKGETRKLADLAGNLDVSPNKDLRTTSVILCGPYGASNIGSGEENVLTIAGGTGISFTLPAVLAITKSQPHQAIEMVWIIRKTQNLEWIKDELLELKERLRGGLTNFRIRIFITRCGDPRRKSSTHYKGSEKTEIQSKTVPRVTTNSASDPQSVSSELDAILSDAPGFDVEWLLNHHPNLCEGRGIVDDFLNRCAGSGRRSQVIASGPGALGRDLRKAVAVRNEPGKVWKGDEAGDVGMYWDDRLG
jgi:predicted ferric reductase